MHTITCADPQDTSVVWRIGEWDGSPQGFMNFDATPMKPTYMHPSDPRLAPWKTGNYIVGTSQVNSFPGYMWKEINNGHLVYFRLNDQQLAKSFKIRIGITEGQMGGRPAISVNKWDGPAPAEKTQGTTRSLTVGTYRGNNQVYEYTVPASAWVKSAREFQVLKINVITGKNAAGYLSGGISIDALDMVAV
jgi:rhamnogalacturonan endolyase